jgi:DNA-binding transcriptional regulator LsrR (DeoR family)
MAGKESRKIISRTDNLEVAQFNLKHPHMNLPGIEDELRKEFGLKDVVVTLALHYQRGRAVGLFCHDRLPTIWSAS